jgi:hypothetical protein
MLRYRKKELLYMKELSAGRRVTFIFDREGWSPKYFTRWFNEGVDVMTYRKGRYEPWSEDSFTETGSMLSGEPVWQNVACW